LQDQKVQNSDVVTFVPVMFRIAAACQSSATDWLSTVSLWCSLFHSFVENGLEKVAVFLFYLWFELLCVF